MLYIYLYAVCIYILVYIYIYYIHRRWAGSAVCVKNKNSKKNSRASNSKRKTHKEYAECAWHIICICPKERDCSANWERSRKKRISLGGEIYEHSFIPTGSGILRDWKMLWPNIKQQWNRFFIFFLFSTHFWTKKISSWEKKKTSSFFFFFFAWSSFLFRFFFFSLLLKSLDLSFFVSHVRFDRSYIITKIAEKYVKLFFF